MALQVTPIQHTTTPPIPAPKAEQEVGFIKFRGRDVGWSKHALPLWITIHPDLEPWRPLIEEEADAWNKRIGVTIFRIATKSLTVNDAGSVIPFRPVWDQSPHTRLFFGKKAQILAGPVYLPHIERIRNYYVRQRVIAHELGHVLGLNHDTENPSSLMYPVALPIDWEVTKHDLLILKKKYGPRRQRRRDPSPDDVRKVPSADAGPVIPISLLGGSPCSDAGMLWMQAK